MPESESLLDYRLDNGLAVTCLEPNKIWDLRFDNGETLKIDVRFEALMAGFDIHDPDMDPRAKRVKDDLSGSAAYTGHFDMTGKVTGEMVLHGRKYAIDALSTMDHSWGTREERQLGTMTWLQAHFNHDLAIHSMFSFDPTIGPGQQVVGDITHGYIMEKGRGIGLKEGTATINRTGMYADTIDLNLLDAEDRVWKLSGDAQTQFPCQFWPGSMAFMVMPKWRMGDLTGYGTSTDFLDLYHYTKIYN
ncbi:hypothetical protein ACN94_18830 [Gordonia paraffinivorans]|nr:hypothetical protein [Gordonia paraffinivorans]